MILTLFIFLNSLLALIALFGYWRKYIWMPTLAFIFIAVFGVSFMTGIEYRTGTVLVTNGSTITAAYTYATYSNITFGIIWMAAWIFAMILLFLEYRES